MFTGDRTFYDRRFLSLVHVDIHACCHVSMETCLLRWLADSLRPFPHPCTLRATQAADNQSMSAAIDEGKSAR